MIDVSDSKSAVPVDEADYLIILRFTSSTRDGELLQQVSPLLAN